MTAADIAQLPSDQRRALLAQLLRERAAHPMPLSFAQQRIWFLDQLDPGNPVYNLPEAWRIRGPIIVEALERSLNQIVQRHESLRTVFEATDGKPVQRVLPALRIQPVIHDLHDVPAARREQELDRILRKEALVCFDLARGPLIRAHVVKLAPDDHALVLNMHHIISDAWSSAVFCRELSELYNAQQRRAEPSLPKLRIQYGDFAEWQRQHADNGVFERQIAYWREKLGGELTELNLPYDRPRPAVQTIRGSAFLFDLPASLVGRLTRLANEENGTLFMVLLAAFNALLYRYTGQTDILLGTPVAGRSRAETEALIGFFVSTVVLRTQLDGSISFRELLRRVRETALGAFANQDVPFERVINEVRPERNAGQNPLVRGMFVLQNTPPTELKFHGTTTKALAVPKETSQFDLMLTFMPSADGLTGEFEFNTDLFERSTIEGLARHFRHFAEAICEAPETEISRVALLGVDELQRLTGGSAPQFFGVTETIHDLFERQAAERPDAEALAFEGMRLTYGELNAKADRIAAQLRELGAGPERIIGVCLPRSIELVAAILGILKSGAAYLPLDPAYPAERLAFMLRDSASEILVTTTELAGSFASSAPDRKLNIVCIDAPGSSVEAHAPMEPARATPDSLAYVIYTSGSTGQPKGVPITHRNVVRLFRATEQLFGFDEKDVWTLFHSCAFDFSVWELWGALLYGGRLVVVPFETSRSPDAFADLVERERVTVLNQTPSAFRQFIQADAESRRARDFKLRYVVFGGEALDFRVLRPWLERRGDSSPQLVNMYGITETTVHVTFRKVSKADLDDGRTNRIGAPLADLELLLLDAHLQPVPIGVAGEIFVGGAGLGRGYLKRPELTRERFIPHPFRTGERLYRSGDLARRTHDGDFEYLGRADQQVKIRGFRIEPGEIQHHLSEFPAVQSAVVVPLNSVNGDTKLAAYVVPRNGLSCSPAELRRHLQSRLPDYMVPAAYAIVPSLPLTPNGKLDRRALPRPEPVQTAQAGGSDKPLSGVEETLARVWCDVLGLAHVGAHDNFFDVGGDSILSIQIVARARKAGLHLSPKHLFQHQTIAELASVVSSHAPEARTLPANAGATVPLTPIQHWFFEKNFRNASHWNLSVLLENPIAKPELWERALQAVVEHHEAFRLRFHQRDGAWIQTVASAGTRESLVSHFDLAGAQPAQREKLISELVAEGQASLDIENGPLIRALLFHTGSGARVCLVTHHLIVDGVSLRILLEDLGSALRQVSEGKRTIELAAGTTSFANWAKLLAREATASRIGTDIQYWLGEWPKLESVPVDFPSGTNSEHSTRVLSAELDESTTSRLLRLPRYSTRAAISDALTAAVALAISQWTGKPGVHLNLEGHGRDVLDVDLSRTVGWFTSLYPVTLRVPGSTSFEQVLATVRRQLDVLRSPGESYGIGRYFGGDATSAALKRIPEPGICVNYLGQLDRGAGGPGELQVANWFIGPARSPDAQRVHVLEVNAMVWRGRLHVEWRYSAELHRESTVASLLHSTMKSLQDAGASSNLSAQTPSEMTIEQPPFEPERDSSLQTTTAA